MKRTGTADPPVSRRIIITGGVDGMADLPKSRRRIFNILADRVDTVAPWLAKAVMADVAAGDRSGSLRCFAWLTTPKVLGRFLTAGFHRRDLFER